MREIVVDTETTGLDFRLGHRIIEIGCLELIDHMPSGRTYHVYIDPERDVPDEAVAIHGITRESLIGKPVFAGIADEFLDFVGSDPLVIHNAGFDVPFLNHELEKLDKPTLSFDRVVDTLLIARRRHPGQPNNLDALCTRYRIDNSSRTLHGALLDSELLAEVYVELIGARQTSLGLSVKASSAAQTSFERRQERPVPLEPRINAADIEAHRAFVAALSDTPIWHRYLGAGDDSADDADTARTTENQ